MGSSHMFLMMLDEELYADFKSSCGHSPWTSQKALTIQHWFATLYRLVQGCFSMIVTMIIIVQSNNLSNLFKDFAAMTFISVMNNIAFITVLEGLLGHDLRATARKVTKLKVCEHEDKGFYSIKWVILVLTLFFMRVTLVTFSGMQSMGYLFPISLTLQVGDEEMFLMQARNGVYKRTKVKHHRRYCFTLVLLYTLL